VAAAADHLALRGGVRLKKDDIHPAAKDLKRMGCVEIADRILSMNGRSTLDMGRGEMIRAALTTSDFPSLLANVANKSLIAGYAEANATHRPWTASREVPDFKPATLVALSEAPALEEVPEAAEYTFGALDDAKESASVKTYGRLLRLTRQALINDDLSAFTRLPQAFGSSAVRLEADLVYQKLTSNPTMSDTKALFHADHGNLAASGAALSVTSLGAARAAMRKQKGIQGLAHLDPAPKFLIVPVALETQAEAILASLADPEAMALNEIPAYVQGFGWVRGLTLIADPRLDEASATAWYLAADPVQHESIARLYLQQQTEPFLDEDVEFTTDAIAVKCRHDFGAVVVDYRGMYKNPGA
jgi:hypothetical protein